MGKKTDIIPLLQEIVAENATHYQDDLLMDAGQLSAAMLDPVPENRVFLWMCRPCGTWCFLEREVFLRDTVAHNTWTYQEYIIQAEKIKAYRITVAPGQPGPGSLVPGELQPLNYREQVERVKRLALPIQQVKLVIWNTDKTLIMLFADYSAQRGDLTRRFGPIDEVYYQPENEGELSALLYTERHPPKQRSRRPKKPPAR